MNQAFNIAVVGATSLIGQTIIELLEQMTFPVGQLFALGDDSQSGQDISFHGDEVEITSAETFDWTSAHFAFFVDSRTSSERYLAAATDAGCVVIDGTGYCNDNPNIPLVIPEVNDYALADFRQYNVVASPSPGAIQLMLALKPLYENFGVTRVNVTSFEAVSSEGNDGLQEMATQTAKLLNARPVTTDHFDQQIAFNTLSQIGEVVENGYTTRELEVINDCQRLLGDFNTAITVQSVVVPVFYGTGQAVNAELMQPALAEQVADVLRVAPGIKVYGADAAQITPVSTASGNDYVHISRLRDDVSHPQAVNFWSLCDGVRKGSATNCIQIAQSIIQNYY